MRASPARLIFALALLCGLTQMIWPVGFGFGAGWETVAIARELAHTGTYANPFQSGPSGATAVIAPLFPLYIAALIKLLGDVPALALVASLAAILAQALHAALLPRVSALFFGTDRPGIFAGVFSALAFRLMPQWDAAFTSCGLLLFFLNSSTDTWRTVALSGVAGGLLMLANPATILITGPWMIYLRWRQRVSFTRVAAFGAAVFLVVLPWMVRNDWILGTFSMKDNFGMTAYASNNDCAKSSIAETGANGCYAATHPNTSVQELRLLNHLGEAGYDQRRTADTVGWVRTHPGAFVQLTGQRVLDFWFPSAGTWHYTFFVIQMITAVSLPGVFLMARRKVPVVRYMFTVGAIYPLLYYIVVSDVRYRYPVLWLSLLCGGYLLNELSKLPALLLKRRAGLKCQLLGGVPGL